MAESKIDILLKVTNEATKELDLVSKKLKELGVVSEETSQKAVSLSQKFKDIGSSVTKTGVSLAAIGAAPTAAIVAATKAAIDFESAFAGVKKTVDATEEEYATLAKSIRNMAKEMPIAATELASIMEIAGQLGVRGTEELTKFTDTVAKISVSTNLTSDAAATAFARIANIMREPLANIDKMGSVVVDLGNNFATTESEILEFTNRIAGAGKIANLTTKDIFAIGTSFSSVGVQAEAGGTAVQKVLMAMTQEAASATETAGGFASVLEMTGEQYRKLFADNPAEAFRLFVTELGQSGDEAIGILDELDLSDQRLMRGFLSLAQNSDILTNALNMSNQAWEENSALTIEANKRFGTVESQLAILKNRFNELGIEVGNNFKDKLQGLLIAFEPVLNKFATWVEQNPEVVATVLEVGAAVGVVGAALVAIGGVITLIGGLLNPVSLIIIGITAAVVLLYEAWQNNWGGMRDTLISFWEYVQPFIQALGEVIQQTLIPIIDNFKASWEQMQPLFAQIGENLQSLVPIVQFAGGVIAGVIMIVMGVLSGILNAIALALPFIVGIIDGIVTAVTGFLDIIVGIFTLNWDLVWQGTQKLWNGIRDLIKNICAAVVAIVTGFVQGVVNWFKNLYNVLVGHSIVPDMVKAILQCFADLATKAIAKVIELITGIVEKFTNLASQMIGIGKNIVEGLWNGISSMAGWIGDKIGGFVSGIVDKFKNAFDIHSPSKIFAEIGRFNIMGLEQGMAKKLSGLDISAMVDPILPTISQDVYYREQAAKEQALNEYSNNYQITIQLEGSGNSEIDANNIATKLQFALASGLY